GAFGLAAIAGAVFLLQEKQLRSHRPRQSFFRLPPIVDLGRLNSRLMLAGFLLLSAGLVAGFVTGEVTAWVKFVGGGIVWVIYAVILQMGWLRHLPPRRGAFLSMAAFCFSFFTLIGMEHLARTVT
ncbi:MAG: cytochrome c biogenesis protein CcsA, partial [Verrucomicrobiia bacterium]